MNGHVGFTRGVNEWQVSGLPSHGWGRAHGLGQLGHSWAADEFEGEQEPTRLGCMIRALVLVGGGGGSGLMLGA